jgi:lipopolysaccharide transport system permease protein
VTYLDPEKSVRGCVMDAWRGRHVLPLLALYVILRRYTRTYLGSAWMFVRPAIEVGGAALLFGGVLRVSSQDGTPYVLFFTAGILGWRLFERTVYWVTRSFERLGRIMRKLELPLLLVPIAGSSPALMDAVFYFLIFVIITLSYLIAEGHMWVPMSPEILAAPAGLLLCMVFGVAIGLFTSVVNAHTRDVRYVLRYVLQLWMFATPVIYPISRLPSDLQPVAQANPMAAPIELVKHGLLGSGNVQLVPVLWSCLATLLLLAGGLWFFSRRASNFMGPAGLEDEEEEEEEAVP